MVARDERPDQTLVERYSARFANLHSQIGAEWWPDSTLHRAPHKPLLLLSVLDLIATGHIQANRIELDQELRQRFRSYKSLVMHPDKRPDPTVPFRYMATERFWHFAGTDPGAEVADDVELGAEDDAGEAEGIGPAAQLDPELFALLEEAGARQELRELLVSTYFAPDVHPALLSAAAQTNGGSGTRYWWVNGGPPKALDGDVGLLWTQRESRDGRTIQS
jgi:hypothetical protein